MRIARDRSLLLGAVTALCLTAFATASADMAALTPSQDNSIWDSGDLASGEGEWLYGGESNSSVLMRVLITFDVAGTVPAGSTITSATLTLNASRVPDLAPFDYALHRLNADWGEGASDSGGTQGSGGGGNGAAAASGDATWQHTFYSGSFWTSAGGDFVGTPSATTSVANLGSYDWTSAQLAADVQAFLDTPASNFGWILIGDETTQFGGTAKRFDSRENTSGGTVPTLTVEFAPPPGAPGLQAWGVALLGAALVAVTVLALRRTAHVRV